ARFRARGAVPAAAPRHGPSETARVAAKHRSDRRRPAGGGRSLRAIAATSEASRPGGGRGPARALGGARRRQGALALLEVRAASVLGVFTLGALLALSRSVGTVYTTVATTATSTESRSSAVDALRGELRNCRLHSVAADGSSVTYSMPIQAGTYGGFTDDSGA